MLFRVATSCCCCCCRTEALCLSTRAWCTHANIHTLTHDYCVLHVLLLIYASNKPSPTGMVWVDCGGAGGGQERKRRVYVRGMHTCALCFYCPAAHTHTHNHSNTLVVATNAAAADSSSFSNNNRQTSLSHRSVGQTAAHHHPCHHPLHTIPKH